MLIKRQAQDVINQHIDILINLSEDLSLIEHEGFKGEKPLKTQPNSSIGFFPNLHQKFHTNE